MDEVWAFVVPNLTLIIEDAPQPFLATRDGVVLRFRGRRCGERSGNLS